jgi:hypothetical protein
MEKKSRVRWLHEGDKNTKFFHNSLLQRRIHNQIKTMKLSNGDLLEKQKIYKRNWFTTLMLPFKKLNQITRNAIKTITNSIPSLTSQEHNQSIMHLSDLQRGGKNSKGNVDGKFSQS